MNNGFVSDLEFTIYIGLKLRVDNNVKIKVYVCTLMGNNIILFVAIFNVAVTASQMKVFNRLLSR